MSRVETGPYKFGDDWTGFFLRGDDAFGLAMSIEGYLKMGDKLNEISLMEWARRLKEVNENKEAGQ